MPQFMWSSLHFVAHIFCFHNSRIWFDFSSMGAQSCAIRRDDGAGVEELMRPIYIYLYVHQSHSLSLLLRRLLLLRPVTSCRASSGYRRGQSCTLLLCDDTKNKAFRRTNSNAAFCCLCMFSLFENSYFGLELE